MNKILLYYKYVDISHPKRVMKWQHKVCQELGLRGRILIAQEGINGTVGGSAENLERYKEIMSKNPLFTDIDFKEGYGDAQCFPRLQVTVKDEVVKLGLDTKKITPEHGGKHLKPDQVHELLKQNPEDLVILDTRNDYEWKIGHFSNAILPNIKTFRDLPDYIDEHLDTFKDKQVLMYCTGGVRCERATTYMKSKGVAKEVFQVEGGIHRYVEQYPEGFFRGKNYVFDSRIAVKINDDILGSCDVCNTSCDDYTNCRNAECNKHFISCTKCLKDLENTCSARCHELVQNKQVTIRPEQQKVSFSTHEKK